jgi:hypothetical protein
MAAEAAKPVMLVGCSQAVGMARYKINFTFALDIFEKYDTSDSSLNQVVGTWLIKQGHRF